jgi:hypothetical protein
MNGTRGLLLFSVGTEGAQQLARSHIPEAELDAMVGELKARGVDVAETDLDSDATFVWIRKPDGIEVYDANFKVLECDAERATLVDSSTVSRTDIARVIAYGEGFVTRGVKAVLQSGKEVNLLIDVSVTAMEDPMYTRNQLLFDTGWCSTLGIAIADWAGAAFDNHI